jgi:hypothetical protein
MVMLYLLVFTALGLLFLLLLLRDYLLKLFRIELHTAWALQRESRSLQPKVRATHVRTSLPLT